MAGDPGLDHELVLVDQIEPVQLSRELSAAEEDAARLRASDRGGAVGVAHRAVAMAIERGKLQDLIFDNRDLWSHRALAAVLGAILKLPPVQRALVSRQAKSVYLETMIARTPH